VANLVFAWKAFSDYSTSRCNRPHDYFRLLVHAAATDEMGRWAQRDLGTIAIGTKDREMLTSVAWLHEVVGQALLVADSFGKGDLENRLVSWTGQSEGEG
jgi:hypothetical protein